MRLTNKRNSIYAQLLQLLIVSAVISVIAFFLFDFVGEYSLEKYLEKTNYVEKENREYVNKLQKYIEEEQISSRDAVKINQWIKKQKLLSVRIYKDSIMVFDSAYPEQDIWEKEIAPGNYGWENYYIVNFSDGVAEIIMTGTYSYKFYNYVLIAELSLSFAVFLLSVLLGIRKKMDYILKLSDEIEILEGGSLDYPITVSGKDELSVLAQGLDSMRISFRNLIKQEADMVRENQRIVTQMSHDLRTPVTSIMLYTEILKKGKYKSDVQLKEYIDKIDQKAHRMKQLTDHLFEYSLIVGKEEVKLEKPELYEVLFYDLFSETCNYLQQRRFKVKFCVQWVECKIQISTDYVIRIMDNITTNIIKYADPSFPIIISSLKDEDMTGFVFENKILTLNKKVESTGIGIQSIRNMMQKMNGKCIIEETKERFRIILLFPHIENS